MLERMVRDQSLMKDDMKELTANLNKALEEFAKLKKMMNTNQEMESYIIGRVKEKAEQKLQQNRDANTQRDTNDADILKALKSELRLQSIRDMGNDLTKKGPERGHNKLRSNIQTLRSCSEFGYSGNTGAVAVEAYKKIKRDYDNGELGNGLKTLCDEYFKDKLALKN